MEPIEKPSKRLAKAAARMTFERDLAHHIDLKAVLTSRKTILSRDLEHAVCLVRRAAEGDHHHDISEAHFLP